MSDLCPVAVSQDSANLADQTKTAGEAHLLLLKQKKYCDVTFTFPNLPDRIEAHEFLLKARSPVFEQIFRMRKSGNVEGNEIEISESTPETFQQFLEFIYADKLEVDIPGALDILQLAHKYKIQPLTDKCEEIFETEIKLEESVQIFEAARRYGRQELMDRAGDIMIKSFQNLVRMDTLMKAQGETIVYLLERDDLSVQEVGLFQFILDWGRNQVGNSGDGQLLKDKLKNVLSKIRYTNMTAIEFTAVVVPTGLLSANETTSVYSYICGDDATRRDLKVNFNTSHRRVEKVEKLVHFYAGQLSKNPWSAPISKQSISFQVERRPVVEDGSSGYLLKKAVITGIRFESPFLCGSHKSTTILNFSISIREHSGPVNDEHFALRFQKVLLNLTGGVADISVDPPVELMPGKTFSIIVEDLSTSNGNFRGDSTAYYGTSFANPKGKANVELEDASLVLTGFQRSTDHYSQDSTNTSEEIVMIRWITTALL